MMMLRMITTLAIDPDVEAKAKEAMRTTGLPFKALINEALRVGLPAVMRATEARPFQTDGRPMGLRPGLPYDNNAELLARAEREDHR
jgi:hypothetical protein